MKYATRTSDPVALRLMNVNHPEKLFCLMFSIIFPCSMHCGKSRVHNTSLSEINRGCLLGSIGPASTNKLR